MKTTLTVLTAAMLVAANAYAEDAPKSLWKASAELGLVTTSGNTETETLNAKATASTDREEWRHSGELTVLKSSDAVNTIAEKYTLMGKSDYKLEGKNFFFGVVTYEDDKFSGYDSRVTEAIGYGRRVIEEKDMTLDLEVGPGARQSKLDSGASESEAMLRLAANYAWTISKSSKFSEALTIEAGEDVTVTKSVTSLASQIEGNLSMKITFTYKNVSEVPVAPIPIEDTDTETAITLVYKF